MNEVIEKFDISVDEWTRVAINFTHVFLQCYTCPKMRVYVGPDVPTLGATNYFVARKMHVIRYLKPFHAVWVRADTTPIKLTVVKGLGGAGFDTFGRTVFSLFGPSVGRITVGGSAVPVVDCGGASFDFPNPITIDGGTADLENAQAHDFHAYLEGDAP